MGSGIFKSAHAADRAKAIVQATTHFKDAKVRKCVITGRADAILLGINRRFPPGLAPAMVGASDSPNPSLV